MLIPILLFTFAANTSFACDLHTSKNNVREFYETAFNKHQPKEAMDKYVGKYYKQHNPYVADGKQPFIDYFVPYYKQNPEAHVEIKRMIAEDDLIVVHALSKQNKKDKGQAVVDIFRVEDGKIVEHWDVVQAVPEKSANKNSMF